MLEKMDFTVQKKFLEECAARREIPGGVFAVVTPEEERIFPFGIRSVISESVPVQEDDIFDLASLTKVICTTTIALQELEKGMLSLQTPVKEILSEFPFTEVTIEHLMTHTSGVCSDDKAYKRCTNREELIDFFLKKDLVFQPGSKVEYSDFGYILLGLVLEKQAGDIENYAAENIFGPLRMKDTCFNPARKGKADRCVPTEKTEDRGLICAEVHDGKAWRMGGISGNAGLFSTAGDLSRFVKMLLNGGCLDGQNILSPSTIALLQKCYTEKLNQRRTLGWISDEKTAQMGDYYSSRCLFHTGFTGTSVYVDFKRGCGIILLTNRIHPTRENTAIFEIRRRIHNLTLLEIDHIKGIKEV